MTGRSPINARPGIHPADYHGRMDHPDQVAGHVARTVLGAATAPQPLAAGAWSTAYALTVAGQPMVLRVSRHGGDFAKDETIGAVVGGMLPVPAVTARGEVHGWAYAVSQRLPGTALNDLGPGALAAVLPDLFDVMDAIGRIDVGGHGYGVWDASRTAPHRSWPQHLLAVEHGTPRVPGRRAALAASDVGLEPFERGLATLRRLAPDLPDERRTYCATRDRWDDVALNARWLLALA